MPAMTTPAARERRWRMAFFVVATVYVTLLVIDFVSTRLEGFSQILIVLFLAWLLSFILAPLVRMLVERFGMGRGVAIGLVYAGALLIGGFLVVYSLTAIGAQVGQLVDNFPETRTRIEATLSRLAVVGRLRQVPARPGRDLPRRRAPGDARRQLDAQPAAEPRHRRHRRAWC